MHTVEMGEIAEEVEETTDPIINRVSLYWGEHLGARYPGYLLLLLGAADESLARWLGRSIAAIDSLTGRDAACLLFAARLPVTVKRRIIKKYECVCRHCRSRGLRRPPSDGTVDAYELRDGLVVGWTPTQSSKRDWHHSRLVTPDGSVRWTGSERELIATTYATDRVAGSLGVLDRLPCLIAVDAQPDGRLPPIDATSPRYVQELANFPPANIIPLLRRTLHIFRGHPNYGEFHRRVTTLDAIAEKLRKAESASKTFEQELSAWRRRTDADLLQLEVIEKAVEEAANHLRDGSLRKARHVLAAPSFLSKEILQETASYMATRGEHLHRMCRTLWSLRNYSERHQWPLESGPMARLVNIVEEHLVPLGIATEIRPFDRGDLDVSIQILSHQVEELVQELLSGVRAHVLSLRSKDFQCPPELSPAARHLRLEAARELEGQRQALLSEQAPSISVALREAVRSSADAPVVVAAQPTYDAFLCHSSSDAATVAAIALRMRETGIRYWLDAEQITLGDGITEKIEDGLRRSRRVLVFISRSLRRSRWCRAEYGALLSREFAGHSGRGVIPVVLDDCPADDIPMLLFDKSRIDARDPEAMATLMSVLTGDRGAKAQRE